MTSAGVYGPRGLALRCALEGREVGAAGGSWRACPYGPDRDYSRRAWLRGYVAGRCAAGWPMPALEVDEDAPWPGDVAEQVCRPDGRLLKRRTSRGRLPGCRRR
jgi:hypothetical protein